MNVALAPGRLAVCSWSLQPSTPSDLVAKLLATDIPRVQLALDPLRESPQIWSSAGHELSKNGITMVSGMFGCEGEDYSTLESIRQTGGLAPGSTWPQNLNRMRAAADLAQTLGLRLVTFHAGFLPASLTDPAFDQMVERLKIAAEIFARRNIQLGLETGQETAEELVAVLRRVNQPNLGVNFDPANTLLYGHRNVIGALRTLAPWVLQVHLKDAWRTKTPGTWGEEVVLGTGEVPWREFFTTLKAFNFSGDAAIEREAGSSRLEDIRAAKTFIKNLTL